MTLKQATLLAIISFLVQVFISVAYLLRVEFYMVLNVLGILCNVALLPFFVMIYQKQKDGN